MILPLLSRWGHILHLFFLGQGLVVPGTRLIAGFCVGTRALTRSSPKFLGLLCPKVTDFGRRDCLVVVLSAKIGQFSLTVLARLGLFGLYFVIRKRPSLVFFLLLPGGFKRVSRSFPLALR